MKWENAIQRLFAGLGSSADEIAATLSATNVRGVRNTVRYLNPIIRYLQDQLRTDDYTMDIWTADASHYVLRINAPDGSKEEIALPAVVKDFLDAFNQGAYPHLELPDLKTP